MKREKPKLPERRVTTTAGPGEEAPKADKNRRPSLTFDDVGPEVPRKGAGRKTTVTPSQPLEIENPYVPPQNPNTIEHHLQNCYSQVLIILGLKQATLENTPNI